MLAHDVDSSIELHCEHCGYNVSNVPHRRCPECGAIFDPHELRLSYDRATRTLRRARRHFFTVPIVGGFIVGPLIGFSRSANLAILATLIFFIIAGYLVALATILAPDVVQARKALGKHGGIADSKLIIFYGVGLIVAQLAIMAITAMGSMAISQSLR